MSDSKYITKYTKDHIRRFEIKLSKKYDADVIDWLESKQNINQYIKQLILKDKKSAD